MLTYADECCRMQSPHAAAAAAAAASAGMQQQQHGMQQQQHQHQQPAFATAAQPTDAAETGMLTHPDVCRRMLTYADVC